MKLVKDEIEIKYYPKNHLNKRLEKLELNHP
jgi:hypothetical protein